MQPLTVTGLQELLAAGERNDALKPVMLIGAGASMPFLPTAGELKRELVRAVVDVGFPNLDAVAKRIVLDALNERVAEPHLTLEVLCSLLRYRLGFGPKGHPAFDVERLWLRLCAPETRTFSRVALSIARLARRGLIRVVLTSNFDAMLPQALDALDVPFCVTTTKGLLRNQKPNENEVEIVAFHGTIHRLNPDDREASPHSPPTSALARGLAMPFHPRLIERLEQRLSGGPPVIAIGYSGGDHYDMNPLLAELSRRGRLGPLLWLSYSGTEADFSTFVRQRFGASLFHAQATILLDDYCREWPSDKEAEVAERIVSERRKIDGAESTAAAKAEWAHRVQGSLCHAGLLPADCRAAVEDLACNLPGAWAVLEHYYLYSNGFDEDATFTFGGVDAGADAVGMEHLDFLGTRFGELLLGQHRYRKDDEIRGDQGGPRGRLVVRFPDAVGLFEGALARFDALLARCPDPFPRPEYRAVIHVGRAIAADYLGLVANKLRQDLDACLRGLPRAIAGWEREYWVHRRDVARQEALLQFDGCLRFAQAAKECLGGLGAHSDLQDIVQHTIWEMIARENTARALPADESLPVFEAVIQMRRELTARAGEFEPAHLSQLLLRCCEMMKVCLRVGDDSDAPAPWRKLCPSERRGARLAFAMTKKARCQLEALVPMTFNFRFPAYFETILLWFAAWGRRDHVEVVLAEFRSAFGRAPERVQRKCERWAARIERRVQAIRLELDRRARRSRPRRAAQAGPESSSAASLSVVPGDGRALPAAPNGG